MASEGLSFFGARFGSNDGALPWVQTADSIQQSMIALVSSRILELGVELWKVADHLPGTIASTLNAVSL